MTLSADDRRKFESLERSSLEGHQLARLNVLIRRCLKENAFYRQKLRDVFSAGELAQLKRGETGPLQSLAELPELPFTLKYELLPEDSGRLPRNATYGAECYVRYHQTSGTRGRPLPVVDTAEDWSWWMDCWGYILDAARVTSDDRVFLAFSFGPFIGFWSAHDAAIERGCLVVPGGGMSTLARLELMRTAGATVLLCTPTYALHMAHVAGEHQIDLPAIGLKTIIVAGEPGGSDADLRSRILTAWGAQVLDHSGATEVGPWGYGDATGDGLFVTESEFIAEFLSLETADAAGEGELSELVLTNLGRYGCPVLRYRTGDVVRPNWSRSGANRFVFMQGGVLGRVDDMLIVRGVNIFPSSVEQIVRSFPEIAEYRIKVRKRGALDELYLEIEDQLEQPRRVANELEVRLGLTVQVCCVPPGSLLRSEGKSRRWIDERAPS
jgi:phenylacetate-CoA ligase